MQGKMKRTIGILVAVVILGAIAILLITNRSNNTIKKELRDFAIEDTASVDRIFMVEKDLDKVLLTRVNGIWMVNDHYIVRQDAIDILLKTLHRMRVKSPVSKAALSNVITMMATRNTKVEVYSGKKLLKTIYVGGPTQDQMGTYMMLEGSSVPFVVHIQGFIGYLSTRFFTSENSWRSTDLLRYNFNDLATVKMENHEVPEESFVVSKERNGYVSLHRLMDNRQPEILDTVSINFYFSYYEKLNCERFVDDMPQELSDSLLNAKPLRTITITDFNGNSHKIIAYRAYAAGKEDVEGNQMFWDDERMYGRIDDRDWAIIQYFVFDKMFLDYSVFTRTTE